MEIEKRAAQLEIRADGRKLVGHAAVFDRETTIGGRAGWVEVIRRGAFAKSLTGDLVNPPDILALLDHDATKLLARTRSGTLRLLEDEKGLAYEIALPSTSIANDVLELARRSDLGGASIGFLPHADGDRWSGKHREIRSVDLKEISIVSSWPAYSDTTVTVRSALGRGPSSALLARRRWLETLGA